MITDLHTGTKRELIEIEDDDFLEGWNYYSGSQHMTDAEAIERYRKEKSAHPDALVVLDDLDCGHWDISVYSTDEEKEEFIRSKWSDFLGQFKSYLKRIKLPEVLK